MIRKFALVAGFLLVSMNAAEAEIREAFFDGIAANGELAALMNELQPSGHLPKLSDNAKISAILQRAFNIPALMSARPAPASDYGELRLWLRAAVATQKRYEDFFAGMKDDSERKTARTAYEDEIVLMRSFGADMMANLIQASLPDLITTRSDQSAEAARQQGLEFIRGGTLAMVHFLLEGAIQARRPENAEKFSATLAADIPVYVLVLTDMDIGETRQHAEIVFSKTNDEKIRSDLKVVLSSAKRE